jgi:type VI secretion system secreted protein VgrG
MATTQSNRALQIATPFGKDVLLLVHLSGVEQLSTLFHYDLVLYSEKGDLDPDGILGKDVTIRMPLPKEGTTRFFHGFVTEFSQTGYARRFHEYHATVRPALWFLTRSSDCRIFQQKSVPDIFEEVVKPYGITDFKLKLSGSYNPLNYCVQYRETDFNFVSRLLEQEGIYYFFSHQDGKHTLMLVDDSGAHDSAPDYDSVPYFPPGAPEAARTRDHLSAWSFSKSVQPGAFATTDYDFEAPSKSLAGTASISQKYGNADYEMFDYPADLSKPDASETKRVAKIRMQELQATQSVGRGSGNAAGLTAGCKFSLAGHPRDDVNRTYLITSVGLEANSDAHEAGKSDPGTECSVSVETIDLKTPFRPHRTTPKPTIQGTQTATVVGKSGEEVYTDQYGRVKLQFPWDRVGKNDENSGCWVSVAQVWAGKQWGAMHIPRIGQEVIVSFLEGDPDRPIITGRVYNGANMPPWALPANMTQSGIMSQSSKGGTLDNFNMIRFEDLKGSELLTIHAEKDESVIVEHNESVNVGNDRTESVGANETITIGKNRTESVGGDESITVSKNRTESVTGKEQISIGDDRSLSVSGSSSTTVSKDDSLSISGASMFSVSKDATASISGNRTQEISKNDTLSVGKNLTISAQDNITIATGSASISMSSDGTITIQGQNISIKDSGGTTVQASGNLTMKGSKITHN